jgi:Protein of unknown function (DUF1553)/Protein of unknown function (DUF1549)
MIAGAAMSHAPLINFKYKVATAFKVERRALMLRRSCSLKTFAITLILVCAARTGFAADEVRPRSKGKEATHVRSSDPVVAFIDQQIRQGWTDNDVVASSVAEDAEWFRRVYLDLVGHIPAWNEIDRFHRDKNPAKRSELVAKLLDSPGFVRSWTTIWTNLTIGRKPVRFVNRTSMERFFREAFAQNRPWNEIVHDLIAAEGRSDQNGAVNYLLAQMTNNDEAVQATAKTTRLFMGVQVQCTQCHNHPFNEWKQDQFWQIDSFLRQTRRINHRKFDAASGRQVDDYAELVPGNFSGPVYFEKRSGEMQVAYPIFFDSKVDPNGEINRRKELARLMTTGENPLIARAMVNRTWGHFFGYGFTTPVDDMGPHKPPSHPELLERLSQEFVKSGYDVRRLIRWICDSEAYGLTSRAGKKNLVDDPSRGHVPLFSRMYPKPLEAEQLYDSLLMATTADNSGETNWADAQKQRDQWLQQFIIAFGTDENDEANTFNGTIPQALLMMNGPLVQKAISAEKGSFLYSVLDSDSSDERKITRLYLATLSRHPRGHEESAAANLLESDHDKLSGFQDLFWALLNSNEFIINH